MMTQGGTTSMTQSGDGEKDMTIKRQLEEIEKMKEEVETLRKKARSMDIETGAN